MLEVVAYHDINFEECIEMCRLAKITSIEGNKRGFRKATISSKDSSKNFFPSGTNHVIWLAEQASTNEDFRETLQIFSNI